MLSDITNHFIIITIIVVDPVIHTPSNLIIDIGPYFDAKMSDTVSFVRDQVFDDDNE